MKTGGYPCEHSYYGICPQCVREERDEIRARVAELEARIAEAEKQEPVAMVVHHNPPFGAVYKVEWYTKYRDLPDGTKLYAGSAPVPAAQAVDVCRVALEEACIVSWIAADLSTIEGAKKAIASLCAFDVQLATDPATNGGKSLQPVPEAQAIDTSTALSVLSKAMQDDADFAWAWHCNIAMTAQDAGAPHDLANVWAANFMRRAFDVDTLSRVNAMLAAKAKEGS